MRFTRLCRDIIHSRWKTLISFLSTFIQEMVCQISSNSDFRVLLATKHFGLRLRSGRPSNLYQRFGCDLFSKTSVVGNRFLIRRYRHNSEVTLRQAWLVLRWVTVYGCHILLLLLG